jgi:hypothetical protein
MQGVKQKHCGEVAEERKQVSTITVAWKRDEALISGQAWKKDLDGCGHVDD